MEMNTYHRLGAELGLKALQWEKGGGLPPGIQEDLMEEVSQEPSLEGAWLCRQRR